MLFSSVLFIFLFLPLCILFFYISPKWLKNGVLLLFSLVFYAWGGVSYTAILLVSILMNYVFGLWIDRSDEKKWPLGLGVSANLLILIVFKYTGFFVENTNRILWRFELPSLEDPGLLLPVGISFFTFQSVSYLVDIYRKEAAVQRNFVDLALYISLFPQLIAGPIVRYHDIDQQLKKRRLGMDVFAAGVERFILGLAKKVLLANTFGNVADQIFNGPVTGIDTPTAWLGIIAYSLQIYYDFSGYSDMAIGLGRMFGFQFLENFNFPYIAQSIQDFWRRWHISLSSWFRDYLYIPLGGNRVSPLRLYRNLFIVFFLTGFWHGSSWNFIFWGLFHGFFIVLERIGFAAILNRLWRPLRHLYTLLVVMFAWVFFRASDLSYGWSYCKTLLGLQTNTGQVQENWQWYTDQHFYLVLALGLLSAGGFWPFVAKKFQSIMDPFLKGPIFQCIAAVASMLLLALSVSYLVAGTYNPFIYFRF